MNDWLDICCDCDITDILHFESHKKLALPLSINIKTAQLFCLRIYADSSLKIVCLYLALTLIKHMLMFKNKVDSNVHLSFLYLSLKTSEMKLLHIEWSALFAETFIQILYAPVEAVELFPSLHTENFILGFRMLGIHGQSCCGLEQIQLVACCQLPFSICQE